MAKKILQILGIGSVVVFGFLQIISLISGVLKSFPLSENSVVPVETELKPKHKSCPNKDSGELTYFKEGLTPERIVITEVGIDLPIVPVNISHGTWKVNSKVANYAVGTSLINPYNGNVGIYAHDRKSEFTNIKKLKEGSIIEVYADGHLAKYIVKSGRVAEPTDIDVFYPTQRPSLTLVTCDGLFSEKRFILTTELVEINELDC